MKIFFIVLFNWSKLWFTIFCSSLSSQEVWKRCSRNGNVGPL